MDNNETKSESKEIQLENFYVDPINKFWLPIYNEIQPKISKFFENEFENDEELKKQIDSSNKAIRETRLVIATEKRSKKITAKKVANVFIIISFFLIFGLFFIPFLKSNLRAIKEFNDFEKKHLDEITREKSLRSWYFNKTIAKYTPQEIKDTILSYLSFNRILDVNSEEIDLVSHLNGFAGIAVVNKYESQRRTFYDMLYFNEYHKIITTSNSITITVYDSEGRASYRVLTAYHRENTPFIDIDQLLNLPTNYLPKLEFYGSKSNVTDRQYNKMKKTASFVFENVEFVKRFHFDTNDEIGLMTYFPVAIQEKFVQYDNIVREYKLPKVYISKYKKNIYFPRQVALQHLKTYNNSLSWLKDFDIWDDDLNVTKKLEPIKNSLEVIIKALLQGLTIAYLNRNISGEILEDWNQNSHVNDFSGTKNEAKRTWELHTTHISNIINSSRKFTMVNNSADRPVISQIVEAKKSGSWFDIQISSRSYWSREEIDNVWVEGEIIPVPYVRYYPFSENKRVFHHSEFCFNDPNIIVSTSQLSPYYNVFSSGNEELDELIKNNRITFNRKALNEMPILEKTIRKINSIYTLNPEWKNKIEIHVDYAGFGVYLNEVPQNFDVISFRAKLDKSFNQN